MRLQILTETDLGQFTLASSTQSTQDRGQDS
jgi:hypothetical protein